MGFSRSVFVETEKKTVSFFSRHDRPWCTAEYNSDTDEGTSLDMLVVIIRSYDQCSASLLFSPFVVSGCWATNRSQGTCDCCFVYFFSFFFLPVK